MKANIGDESESQNPLGTWQYHLDYIRKSDNFNETQKVQIINGLAKLREFFSDEWLKEATKTGYFHHPLVSYISNYAPWSQLWLADFANRLDGIGKMPRFEELMKRLKDPDQYGGAESESDSLYKLKIAGFDLELYPNIGVGNREADIKASIDNSSYFFEITTLQTSLKAVKARHTFESLTLPYTFINHGEIIVHCNIHKALAEPRIKELQNKIEQAISEVRRSKEFAYIGEPGVMDYLIVHNEMAGELDALLSKYGMKKEISGPAFVVEDIRRLEAKIWNEIEQLPKDRPSIIVMYANLTYFPDDAGSFYSALAYEIEEAIYAHSNLVMAVIIGREAGYRDKGAFIANPNYVFDRTNLNDSISASTLIIKNRYSQFAELSPNENIVAAFIGTPKNNY